MIPDNTNSMSGKRGPNNNIMEYENYEIDCISMKQPKRYQLLDFENSNDQPQSKIENLFEENLNSSGLLVIK